ncbi:hypothetical protein ACQ5SP_12810 [Rhodovulum sp. YNF3179]|uniref:hypothetical protein n=1 Tax=Rhodovulum sp. YNF3179 TaxID=3425127 RepID=UPI003D34E787
MSGIWRFRPAGRGDEIVLRLGEGRLAAETADGAALWTVPLAEVDAMRFTDQRLGRNRRMGLALTAGDATCRVAVAGGAGPRVADPDRARFLDLTRAVLGRVAPETPVRLGEDRRTRVALLVTGGAAMLGGLALGGGAVLAGLPGGQLFALGVPAGLLVVSGAALVVTHQPGARRPVVTAADLAAALGDPPRSGE